MQYAKPCPNKEHSDEPVLLGVNRIPRAVPTELLLALSSARNLWNSIVQPLYRIPFASVGSCLLQGDAIDSWCDICVQEVIVLMDEW